MELKYKNNKSYPDLHKIHNIIKSLGKGSLYFIVQLAKRLLGIGMIVAGVQFGIMGMLYAVAIFGYLCYIINAVVVGRLIHYGLFSQMRDWMGYMLVTILSAVAAWGLSFILDIHPYLLMTMQIILFCCVYLALSLLFKLEGFSIYWEVVVQKWKQIRNRS